MDSKDKSLYEQLSKDELIGMLEARDQKTRLGDTGAPAYRLSSKNPAFSGGLVGIYFQSGEALVPVDLDAEAILQAKIKKARSIGDSGRKELNQLEALWGETVTHKVRQLESDFGITYVEVNFPVTDEPEAEEIEEVETTPGEELGKGKW